MWEIALKPISRVMSVPSTADSVHALSAELTAEYGKGFTRSNLFYMIRFAEVYPDEQIVHALSGQLSWTHFRQIIYIGRS